MKFTYCDTNRKTISSDIDLLFPGFGKDEVLVVMSPHDDDAIIGTGYAMLAAQQAGIPIYSYKPMQVKQAVVGYGNATKHQVMEMTKRLLGLEKSPKPDDAADAVAIALCHGRSSTSLLSQLQK